MQRDWDSLQGIYSPFSIKRGRGFWSREIFWERIFAAEREMFGRWLIFLLDRYQPEFSALKGPIWEVQEKVEAWAFRVVEQVLSDVEGKSLEDLPVLRRVEVERRIQERLADLGLGY